MQNVNILYNKNWKYQTFAEQTFVVLTGKFQFQHEGKTLRFVQWNLIVHVIISKGFQIKRDIQLYVHPLLNTIENQN